MRPQKQPKSRNSGTCSTWNISLSESDTAMMGEKPWNTSEVMVAVIEAKSNGMIDFVVISSIRISSTKTTPVIGALKTAATAAPAPQHSSSVMFL